MCVFIYLILASVRSWFDLSSIISPLSFSGSVSGSIFKTLPHLLGWVCCFGKYDNWKAAHRLDSSNLVLLWQKINLLKHILRKLPIYLHDSTSPFHFKLEFGINSVRWGINMHFSIYRKWTYIQRSWSLYFFFSFFFWTKGGSEATWKFCN